MQENDYMAVIEAAPMPVLRGAPVTAEAVIGSFLEACAGMDFPIREALGKRWAPFERACAEALSITQPPCDAAGVITGPKPRDRSSDLAGLYANDRTAFIEAVIETRSALQYGYTSLIMTATQQGYDLILREFGSLGGNADCRTLVRMSEELGLELVHRGVMAEGRS